MTLYFSSLRLGALLLVMGLLLGGPQGAAAQEVNDGSVYSRFGLGELRAFSSSQSQALGGGGTALWSFNYANFGNPATWGHHVLTRAAAGVRVDGLQATDASNETKRLTAGSLNAFHFAFPILSNKLGAGIAFEPYSRVNYRVQSAGQLVTDPTAQDTSQFQINYEGSGGLQQIRGGVGYRVTDGLSLGVSADLIFGIIEEGRRTTFPGSADLVESNLATSTRLAGLTGTLGALYVQRNLFREQDDLSVAVSLTLPASLSGNRAQTLGESLDRDTLGVELEGTMDLPLGVRAGVAYQTDSRWVFVADGRYEPWSQFKSDLSVPGYLPGGVSRFQDRMRLSAGVEFLPAGADLSASFLERVAYRFGVYYDQAYVTPVENVALNTTALTGGLSLPALFPGTRLDVNLEAGTRGTTDQDLVRDVFYGVSVTLNVGERWFTRRKLR